MPFFCHKILVSAKILESYNKGKVIVQLLLAQQLVRLEFDHSDLIGVFTILPSLKTLEKVKFSKLHFITK